MRAYVTGYIPEIVFLYFISKQPDKPRLTVV